MWGESIRENEFLFFWLVLGVAISLRVMRPVSSDAEPMGGGWMSCTPLCFAFSKALKKINKRLGVSMPLHFLSTPQTQATMAM